MYVEVQARAHGTYGVLALGFEIRGGLRDIPDNLQRRQRSTLAAFDHTLSPFFPPGGHCRLALGHRVRRAGG